MKFSAAIVATGAAFASAQSISSLVSQIPSCADSCLVQYVTQVCGSLTDYACQCMPANVATLTTDLTPCVLKACTTAEALQLQSLSSQICSVYAAQAGSGTASASTAAASSSMAAASSSAMMMTSTMASSAASSYSSAASALSSAVSSSMAAASSAAASSSMMESSAVASAASSISSAAMSSMAATTTMAVAASSSAAAAAASTTMLETFTGAAGPMATAGPVGAILAAAIALAL